MFRTKLVVLTAALAVALMVPGAAQAQQQSLSFNVGYFWVNGESGRVDGDTIVANLGGGDFALDYKVEDFNNATFGAEWLVRMGKFLEVGVGAGYYAKSVPSFYAVLTHDDGRDITQDLRLRVVPVTVTARYFPLSHRAAVQPYIGAGVGVAIYRYSETGEFVDGDYNVFRANYVATGTATGPVILGGVRLPVNHN